MNTIQKLFAVTAMFCSLTASSSAHATLIDGAWGGTTLDTASGLTWVDISQTKSLSINMALNSSWVTDLGFKYASLSQVEQLFSNVGIISGDREASGAAATELALNLGTSYTYFTGSTGVADVGRGIYGYDIATHTAGWADFTVCTNCGSSFVKGWNSSGAETDWSNSLDVQIYSRFSGYTGGHWLVLDTNEVPAPSAILLMMSGFLALGLSRRRLNQVRLTQN